MISDCFPLASGFQGFYVISTQIADHDLTEPTYMFCKIMILQLLDNSAGSSFFRSSFMIYFLLDHSSGPMVFRS